MKIGNIVGNAGQRVIYLVITGDVFSAQICQRKVCALTKGHLPIGIHATSRIDSNGQRIDIAAFTTAIHKEISEGAFDGWVFLSIPICSYDGSTPVFGIGGQPDILASA